MHKVLSGLMVAVLAFYSLQALYHSYEALSYPYSLDYTEGIALEFARRASMSESMYLDIEDENGPWLIFAYTPVYFLLNGLIFLATDTTLLWGRVMSGLCMLLIAGLAAAIVTKSTSSRSYGLLAAVLVLTARFFIRWGTLFRPDMLALAFSLAGVYLFLFSRHRGRGDVLAALLFVFAVFTKQNHAIAPAAALVYLVFYDRGRLLPFFGMMSLFGLSSLGLMQLWSGGLFMEHAFRYNLNPYSLGKGLIMGTVVLMRHGIFLFVIFIQRSTLQRMRPGGRFVLVYLLVALAGALSVGKIGSDTNHYLELSLAIILCFCLAASTLARDNRKPGSPYAGLARLLPLLIIFEVVTLSYNNLVISPAYVPDRESRQHISSLIVWLKENGGERIFSEDPLLPILAGKRLIIDPFLVSTLIEQGALAPRIGQRYFSSEFYDSVILKFDVHDDGAYNQWHRERLNPDMRAAMRIGYEEIVRFGPLYFSDARSSDYWFPEIEKRDYYRIYKPKIGDNPLPSPRLRE